MLSKKMEKALNEQINAEIYSSYLYLSMAAFFKDQNLNGFGRWMEVQAQEELAHVKKFFDWIYERRGKVTLDAIEKPPLKWDSPLAAFEAAFEHEKSVSKRVHDLVTLANTEKDYATGNMLQWFVNEQVEEESSVDYVVQKLKLAEGFKGGLFMLDKELGFRGQG